MWGLAIPDYADFPLKDVPYRAKSKMLARATQGTDAPTPDYLYVD